MRIVVLDGMINDDSEGALVPSSDVSNLVVHLGFAFDNQGHSFGDHIHPPVDTSPVVDTGALKDPFF